MAVILISKQTAEKNSFYDWNKEKSNILKILSTQLFEIFWVLCGRFERENNRMPTNDVSNFANNYNASAISIVDNQKSRLVISTKMIQAKKQPSPYKSAPRWKESSEVVELRLCVELAKRCYWKESGPPLVHLSDKKLIWNFNWKICLI